jgi:hypothetical protein
LPSLLGALANRDSHVPLLIILERPLPEPGIFARWRTADLITTQSAKPKSSIPIVCWPALSHALLVVQFYGIMLGSWGCWLMSSEKDTAEALIWITGTKVSCKVADILGEMTTRHLGDQALLEFAKVTKLRSLPRAQKYLSIFLNGKGPDQWFPLSELLNDTGVRDTIRRHFNARISHLNGNLITIGQRAYTNPDWKNSLGTYFIYYIDIGNRPNLFGKETRHVLAWGEDTYQWAPEDAKRFTQCVHQAASRLQNVKESQVPKAATFKMFASDTIIDTTTGMPAMNVKLSSELVGVMRRKTNILRARPQSMCRGH